MKDLSNQSHFSLIGSLDYTIKCFDRQNGCFFDCIKIVDRFTIGVILCFHIRTFEATRVMKLVLTVISSVVCLLFLTKSVHAAESFTNVVFCADTVPVDSPSFEVCATAYYASPSPAEFPNGTVVYVGGYYTTYTITQGLKEGDEPTGSPNEYTGIEITVHRDDYDACDVSVTVDKKTTQCNQCNYCRNDAYSVDCTNVENGRSFDVCESTASDSIFFPLSAVALENSNEVARMAAMWVHFRNIFQNFVTKARSLFGSL